MPVRVGIVAVQGGFEAHASVCEALGAAPVRVRRPEELAGVHALILPGGESTTQAKLSRESGLMEALASAIDSGLPTLATCAGAIMVAARVVEPTSSQPRAGQGWMDVDVNRNGWGRQIHSFEAVSDEGQHPLVFIRAPRIERVGPRVDVVVEYDGEPVGVRQGPLTALTFHPELTDDRAFHEQLIALASSSREAPSTDSD